MILQSVNAPTAGPTLPLTGQASAGSHTCPLTRQQPGSSPINLVAACHQAKTWPVASKAQDTTPPYYHRSTTARLHPQEEQRGGPSQTALRDWTATLAIHALQSVRDTVWFFQEHGSTENSQYMNPLQHLCREPNLLLLALS